MTTSKATRKLEGLRKKLAGARERERTIRADREAAVAALRQADADLEEHFAQEDADPEPAEVLGRRAVALAEVEERPWDQQLAGAQRRADAVEAELAAYVVEHFGDLIAECEPDALEARDRVDAALAAVSDAVGEWHGVATRVTAILRYVPGIDGADVPHLPLESLQQELRRLREVEVPAPLPRSLYGKDDVATDAPARAVEAAVSDP